MIFVELCKFSGTRRKVLISPKQHGQANLSAISDEEEATIEEFLRGRSDDFIQQVATDLLRRSFISFGVSGTPTILLIDDEGVVRHRQVGYTKKRGLHIEGWSWAGS